MRDFYASLSNSWLDQLSSESLENYERSLSRVGRPAGAGGGGGGGPGRPMYNGHYVEVRPTPLRNPKLVVHSQEMDGRAEMLSGRMSRNEVVRRVFRRERRRRRSRSPGRRRRRWRRRIGIGGADVGDAVCAVDHGKEVHEQLSVWDRGRIRRRTRHKRRGGIDRRRRRRRRRLW